MADDNPVAFKRSDAKRIDGVVRVVERGYRGSDAIGDGGPQGYYPMRYARAASSISAGTGTGSVRTLGSGSANFCTRSGASVTEGSTSFVVWNEFGSGIANDAWLVVGWVQGGWEIVKAGKCSDIL